MFIELGEEADVVFDEEADVSDAPADHGEAFEADAEGEAGESGVVAAAARGVHRFEDGGVDHAATGDFDPARGLPGDGELDVDFKAGFGEGEEVGAEADVRFRAEEGFQEVFEGAFEVADGHILVDVEAFDLVEGGEVGGVDLVAAVGGAGEMMRTGGACFSMARICTVEVCVRRSLPLSK